MVRRYIEAFLPAAQAAGLGQVRFHIRQTHSRMVSVYRGEPEQSVQSEECCLLIEGEAGATPAAPMWATSVRRDAKKPSA